MSEDMRLRLLVSTATPAVRAVIGCTRRAGPIPPLATTPAVPAVIGCKRRRGSWPDVPFLATLAFAVLVSCNPFAPALDEGDPFGDLLGDPTTIDGFFTNFRNAYELRDLSIYEPLLDSSFTFIYYDHDAQVEREWGFAQEIESTRRLFESASLISLRWNQILTQSFVDESLSARIVRPFNLLIALEGGEAFRGDGNVNFLVSRRDTTAAWRLVRWRDESVF